jgi:hypothetical protein
LYKHHNSDISPNGVLCGNATFALQSKCRKIAVATILLKGSVLL